MLERLVGGNIRNRNFGGQSVDAYIQDRRGFR